MLQSRGITRANATSILRQSLSTRRTPLQSSTFTIRQFSQKQSQILSKNRLVRPKHLRPSADNVFAQRSGAARNLSLWSWGSNPKPSEPAAAQPPTPNPPEAQASAPSENNAAAPVDGHAGAAPPAAPEVPDLNSIQLSDLDLDYHSFLDVDEKLGFLKDLGLDYGWGPTSMCQWLLEHVYIYTGLPWWASIAITSALFRAALFYPTLISAVHQARISLVSKHPDYIAAKKTYQESGFKPSEKMVKIQAQQVMRQMYRERNIKIYAPFVGFLVVPFSFGMFRLLRGMAAIPVPSLETGGLAWFTDLSVSDPLYILPSISMVMGILMFRQGQKANMYPTETQQQFMKIMNWVIPPLTFACTYWLPADVQWFLVTFSAMSIVQTTATITPEVRRWVGMPPLPPKGAAVVQGAATRPGDAIYQAPTKPQPTLQETVRAGMQSASSQWKEATGSTTKKAEWKRANDYEEQRAKEDKERQERRLENLRQSRGRRR